jgi:hypothetical protein
MKTLAAIFIAGLTAFGSVGSAVAFSFSPADTHFKLTGTLTITGPQVMGQCNDNTIWRGTTGVPKQPKITYSVFGGSGADCEILRTGLPWQMRATSADKATIIGFGFMPLEAGGIGPCGPGNLFAKINSKGVWTFNGVPLSGGCTVSGSLTSDPPVTVVP